MRKLFIAVVAILTACMAVPLLGPAAILGNGSCVPVTQSPALMPGTGRLPGVEGWDAEQVSNATTIVTVGSTKAVAPWGWVIAVATAIQESGLRNLPGGADDSIGLFQQRPSQGWGTPQQLTDPAYQANRFFDKLLTVAGWQQMPLTEAAQAVQISAYPQAYAQHTTAAIHLVTQISTALNLPAAGVLCGGVSAEGWTQPVHAPIVSGFRTIDRPGHDGVDLGAARHTVIVAAASGSVQRVRCNAVDSRTGAAWGCDRDGDPDRTAGCGWYLDLAHFGGIITRYCHLNSEPFVNVGDLVIAGQPLGEVGSTGHSSGPHLHFEVHLNNDPSSAGAVDPSLWMSSHGAPLGIATSPQQ